MPERDFFDFLATSMTVLEREAPVGYRALESRLSGLRARLESGGVRRVVSFDRSRFLLGDDSGSPDVDAAFERGVVLELVDGATSLDQAILDDKLRVRGAVEAVERFYDGICLYVDAAVRSPGFVPLLERYRDSSGR